MRSATPVPRWSTRVPWTPFAAFALFTWTVPVAVMAAALAGSHVTERPLSDLTRDMAAVAGLAPFLGMVSNVGVLLWCAAAAIALFTAGLLLRDGQRNEQTGFFLVLGSLTAALTVDDLFMVHEALGPRFLGLPELAFLALYGAVFAYLLLAFRNVYRGQPTVFLAGAVGGFGLSVGVDRLPETLLTHHFLLEDGFKLIGIANWLAFTVQTALPRFDSRAMR